jgi:hypothetical protein
MRTNQTYRAPWRLRSDCRVKDLPDPRLAIARQLYWSKSCNEYTDYTQPEPDNYNRAVYDTKRHFCEFIEDQVFYYDLRRRAWISVYYVPQHLFTEWQTWCDLRDPPAWWRQHKPVKLRQKKTVLYTRANISQKEITDNERLYSLGYFDTLKDKLKYFHEGTNLTSRLGLPRDRLDELLQDVEDSCSNDTE